MWSLLRQMYWSRRSSKDIWSHYEGWPLREEPLQNDVVYQCVLSNSCNSQDSLYFFDVIITFFRIKTFIPKNFMSGDSFCLDHAWWQRETDTFKIYDTKMFFVTNHKHSNTSQHAHDADLKESFHCVFRRTWHQFEKSIKQATLVIAQTKQVKSSRMVQKLENSNA